MKDMYEKLAYDYDEFGKLEDYSTDERSFFEDLFSQNGVEKVLDCACGTGQHLFMLLEAGYQAAGSDLCIAVNEKTFEE